MITTSRFSSVMLKISQTVVDLKSSLSYLQDSRGFISSSILPFERKQLFLSKVGPSINRLGQESIGIDYLSELAARIVFHIERRSGLKINTWLIDNDLYITEEFASLCARADIQILESRVDNNLARSV